VLGVKGVGGRQSRRRKAPEEEEYTDVGLMGEVVIPEIRRRWSTIGLMRRRRGPGRARLTADKGSQGTKTPDVDSSPFAHKT